MKKLLVAGVVVVGLGAYGLWSSSQETAQTALTPATPAASEQNPGTDTQPATPNQPVATVYKDGAYVGTVANAFYGDLQVKAVIRGGKLVDVVALTFPNDRETTIDISNSSLPKLTAEAIQTQSSHVDIISGATQTSEAYQVSLESALKLAQVSTS